VHISLFKTSRYQKLWELQNFSYQLFLGDFAKFRKVTISVVMSVRPSVRMEQLGSPPHWTDFHEIFFFRKYKFNYNLTRITGKGKGVPFTGLNRPTGFQEAKAPRFLEGGRLSALRTGRFYPQD
jgi:hypothetical protein